MRIYLPCPVCELYEISLEVGASLQRVHCDGCETSWYVVRTDGKLESASSLEEARAKAHLN